MSKQTEAIKLAIEVFDGDWHDEIVDTDWADKANNAITVLRETLAEQPAQTVSHAIIAGALFDFMGWLTSRKERLVLSGADEASPAADAIKDFATKRGLSLDEAQVREWTDALSAQPPVKTYHDGKAWPVAPAPDPVPIIQQLVAALEGSGTRMRSDQWYIEIEAVAAGKHYLNSKGAGHA